MRKSDDTIRRQDAIDAIARDIPFITFTEDPERTAQRIIGTVPSAEPKTETVLCALADRTCPFQGEAFVWCLTCPHISEEDRDLVKKAIAESRTGEWILNPILPDIHRYKCSICKSHHRERYDYCPSCGAKMVDCGKCKHWESDTGYCHEIADSDSHECNFEQI